MDLAYIAGNNQALITKLEEFGCDVESLLYISKDFFTLCDDLGLNPRQVADVFIKLKNVNDVADGKPISPDIIVYENNRISPTRLSVENRTNGHTIFLKVIPGQGKLEKKMVMYKCEQCAEDTNIKRLDVRDHFLSKHYT
jgi:hypothetical protein